MSDAMLTTTRSSRHSTSEKGKPIVPTVPLQHLEPHSAAGKFLERIPAIDPLGIEHGHRVGNGISGQMMIADDKVDSLGLGISHLFRRLDPAIERDDQLDPLRCA